MMLYERGLFQVYFNASTCCDKVAQAYTFWLVVVVVFFAQFRNFGLWVFYGFGIGLCAIAFLFFLGFFGFFVFFGFFCVCFLQLNFWVYGCFRCLGWGFGVFAFLVLLSLFTLMFISFLIIIITHPQLTDPLAKYIPSFAHMRVLLSEKQVKLLREKQVNNSSKSKNVEYDAKYDVHTVPAKRPITIKHLLTHTSGLACLCVRGWSIRDVRFLRKGWGG